MVTDEGDKQERGISQNKCQTSSDGSYFTEIEQLLKRRTFTRSEFHSLATLVRSRTVDTSAMYQGRSTMYKMARTPYSRVQPSSSLKALKHRNSFLENDIGFVGPTRRIRRKPYRLSSRCLISRVSGVILSIMAGTRSAADGTHNPSFKQPIVHNQAKGDYYTKMSSKKIDDTSAIPSTSVPPPRKASEMALKILQHVDKMVLSKDKMSEFKFSHLSDNSPKKLLPSTLHGQALCSLEYVEPCRFLASPRDILKVDKSLDTTSPAPQNMQTKQDEIDRPSNVTVPFVDPSLSKRNNLSGPTHVDPSVLKSVTPPPEIMRAFHIECS